MDSRRRTDGWIKKPYPIEDQKSRKVSERMDLGPPKNSIKQSKGLLTNIC